ncbi:hypothetical protein [Thalassobellus suaedae]|uniref:Lipoprotein n=1 Tax=Thalassobellus suaedae TaxID=3074124 RepID=A0ABY9Y4G6_9FLAO|nr:hypothetical protein RHP49_01760 [Flavobacteriaceae bacterium HL-DH10]
MRYYLLLFTALFIFSCGKEKVIQLPEISHSDISEINDVSAAYLFYDETKKDSVELNRKNLISTTNWLVNVDKRLTLKQVIPHIQFLQEKKKNSSHKNKDAKNYYTCNDTSKKNLGFIEFTNTKYLNGKASEYLYKVSEAVEFDLNITNIDFKPNNEVRITFSKSPDLKIKTDKEHFINLIEKNNTFIKSTVYLNFNKSLLFKDYIYIKSKLMDLNLKNIQIDVKEFIY